MKSAPKVLLLSAFACSGPPAAAPTPRSDPPTPRPLATATAATAQAQAALVEAWDCTGDVTPSEAGQAETAVVERAQRNPRERAALAAQDKLVTKFCAGNIDCDFLRSRVKTMKTGGNASDVCAMAFIRADDVEEWRQRTESEKRLHAELSESARKFVDLAKRATKSPAPIIALGAVVDGNITGGDRAQWLESHLRVALQAASAQILPLPHPFKGHAPPGIDVVVYTAVRVIGQDLEASWRGQAKNGPVFEGDPVKFPAKFAPATLTSAPALERKDPALTITIDSFDALSPRRANGLCPGDKIQLFLSVPKPLHVRIFNLYGDGDAILLYPNAEHPSSELSGPDSALSAQGFEAIPSGLPGSKGSDVEQYVVIAAEHEGDLAPYAKMTTTCRLPADLARALHNKRGIPARALSNETGYRIVSAERCAAKPSKARIDAMTAALAALPECVR